jgi:hypothetical protein
MPSLPSFDSHFQSLVRWEASEMADPIPMGKGRLKELKALGHKVERFLAARSACWKHAGKDASGILPPWMKPGDSAPGELAGDGLFACAVLMKDEGLQLPQAILEAEVTERLALLWQRCDPAAPKTLPTALAVPADAHAPLWLALLRLRPLRELWERELRRATLESLLDLLPDAWMLDPTPLPPGAVIPRLELASWQDLARLRSSGRRFVIASAKSIHDRVVLDEAISANAWSAAIQKSLDAFDRESGVLVELASDTESAAWVIAFYEKRAGRVDGIGAMALTIEADGNFVPAMLPP